MTKDPSLLIELALTSPITCSTTDWESSYVIALHHHNNDQLIYASNGVISVETEDGMWVVPPTRAVWVPAKVSHSVHISGPMQLVTLQFSATLSPLSGTNCRVLNVSAQLKEGILRSTSFPESYTSTGPEARITAVMLDEIHAAEKIVPLHLPIPTDTRAKKVALKFRENPSLRLSLKDWAGQCGASERTLARIFQSETGMSVGKWQQQARLLRALQVLANGDSVTAAALEVGFKTTCAFITMFRNSMGCTPAQYFQSSQLSDDLR